MCRARDKCGLGLSVVLLRLPGYFLKEPLRPQGKEDGPQAEGAYCSPSIPDKSTRVETCAQLLETGLYRACRPWG